MQIGLVFGELLGPTSLDSMLDEVRAAREAGFSTAWTVQVFGWDALTALALVGREVPDIGLGTAVVPTYPRHPVMLGEPGPERTGGHRKSADARDRAQSPDRY